MGKKGKKILEERKKITSRKRVKFCERKRKKRKEYMIEE